MHSLLMVSQVIRTAVDAQAPIVALESALITHGFSYPDSVAITRRMADAIRAEDGHPAVIGVWRGKARVGLSSSQIDQLAADEKAYKVSVRDLALIGARKGHGGTTVAATSLLAHRSGIRVFATGGIGGIHRGHPEDVSADLPVLATTPIIVVCAGAKSLLDLPRTREFLETWGVPVLGWQTDEFPAFYSRHSGLLVDQQVQEPEEVTEVFRAQRQLGLPQALLVTVPLPPDDEVPADVVEPMIAQAMADAESQGVSGKDLTPFILSRMVALSEARTKHANEALLIRNAQVAARIARALTPYDTQPTAGALDEPRT
ncbi:MAG: pseudouridine-5'-phosphate glycosidase [Anaerolineae bacterium]